MTGEYCAVPHCKRDRSVKGRSFFKPPCVTKVHHAKWRKDFIDVLIRIREDHGFKTQLVDDTFKVCNLHFKTEEMQICKYNLIGILYSCT